MQRVVIFSLALVVTALGCGNGDGSGCAVLSDSTGGQLSQLGTPQLQISVEARFLSIDENFLDQLGVDFDLTTNMGEDNGGAVGGFSGELDDLVVPSGAAGGAANREFVVPQNYDPMSYLGTNWPDFIRPFGDTAEFVMLPPFNCVIFEAGSFTLPVNFPGITLKNLPATDSGLTGAAVKYTFLDDVQLTAVLQALEADINNKTITAPTLTLYNDQRALVTVQDAMPTLGELTPGFANEISGIVSAPTSINTGTSLSFVPHVVEGTDNVILTIRPSLAASAPLGQAFEAGGLPADLEFTIEEGSRNYVKIEVPDGQTVALGGFMQVGQQEESGIPFLKNVPIISWLFGTGSKFTNPNAELLVFLTPHIIRSD
ncbi:MAG: type II secretion system protein GspD [Planctomycetota bacterium]|jgi:type II secretory pathway component GspD/PulD (secretin)